MKKALRRALERTGKDLVRLEIMAAALAGFSRPVPDYEPRFHHYGRHMLTNHEIREEHS